MTFIQEKHEQAIASRLKSLSELLMRDVKKFYDFKKIEFEPRWFAIIFLLKEKGALSVTEIAKEILQSHPAINQTVNILEKKGLIESKKDGNDERKRLIHLTSKGKERIKVLAPLWNDIFNVSLQLLNDSAPLFLEQLAKFEKALSEKSLFDRIIQLDNKQNSGIFLKKYSKELKSHFIDLNQYLGHLFEAEASNLEILNHLEELINNKGEIYFAEYNGTIAGVFCLVPTKADTFEFSRFAIAPEYRRLGIGKFLLESAIERALKLKVNKIILYTSPLLIEANNLYIKSGFYYVENDKKDFYKHDTVKMELNLKQQ